MTATPPPPSQDPSPEAHRPTGDPGPERQQPPTAAQQPYGQQAYGQPNPPGHPQQGGYQPGYAPPPVEGDEKTMMLLAHLSAPLAMLLSVGWVPFLGPLLIWLFYKDRSQAVRVASAGAFNFNLSLTIVTVITWISVIVTLGIGFLWAIPIWIAVFVVQLWCHIKGAIKASRGEVYDYPFQIRLLT